MVVTVKREPSEQELETLGVRGWPIWEKGPSRFPWTYDEPEICYFLDGAVIVTPEAGTPVAIQGGDLVTFPAGLSCVWDIREAVRKHYRFG